MLYLRTEPVEYGSLPLTALLPKLDKPPAVLKLFQSLVKEAKPGSAGGHQRFVSVAAVSTALGLSPGLTRALIDLMSAVSPFPVTEPAEPGPGADAADPLASIERVDVHSLSLFLMMQLYERQAIKDEDTTNKQMEVWPSEREQSLRREVALMSPRSPAASPRGTRPAVTLQLPSLLSRSFSGPKAEDADPWSNLSSPSNSGVFPQGLGVPSTGSMSGAAPNQPQAQGPQVHFTFQGLLEFVNKNSAILLDLVRDDEPVSSTAPLASHEFDRLGFLMVGSDGTVTPPRSDPGNPGVRPVPIPTQPLSGFVAEFEKNNGTAEPRALSDLLLTGLALLHASGGTGATLQGGTGGSLGAQLAAAAPAGLANLAVRLPASGPGLPPSEIFGVNKGTVVRGEDSFPSGSLRVTDCRDATLYLLAPAQFVDVQGCTDCTIVVGAVGKCLRIERCERVQIVAAACRVVVHTCHDCTLFLGVNRPVYVVGDCRFLQLAPYCSKYESLGAHMKAVGVVPRPNLWSRHVHLVRERGGGSGDGSRGSGGAGSIGIPPANLLPPDRMAPFVIPFRGGPGRAAGGAPALARSADELGSDMGLGSSPSAEGSGVDDGGFHLPHDYASALDAKMRIVAELRNAVRTAELPDGKKVELQSVVQAYFKEWLVSSGNMRQVQEIARVEKSDG